MPAHDHDHDHGLNHDLRRLVELERRRQALRLLGGAGALGGLGAFGLLAGGCGGGGADAGLALSGSSTSGSSSTTTSSGSTTSSSGTSSCSVIPEETAGPYPGDGSNSVNGSVANALALSGIVRSDIRSSFGSASGTAAGVPMTVTLTLVNTNGGCAALGGYAIYLWHCDRGGNYSMYSSGVTAQNYLRGVQATDSAGQVSFQTIFPGCYSGRVPHMHFEVYPSLATATGYGNKIRTSQLAFPTGDCTTVYGTATGYGSSLSNFNSISFATDNVFSDGVTLEMTTVSGNVSDGYTATLTVGIAV